MKKLQAQICAALMTSSIALGALPSAQVFAAGSDIDGHWAQQQILTFAENGYIAGDGTGNYLPNQIMTRAQFAAVINRVMGYTEESPSIANYTDVEDSAWYRSDLAKALSAGYMSGTSATTMSPNQPVTREQAAVMIVRLLEENTSVDLSVLDDFTDRGDISAFAVNAMAKLISDGYLYGADGKLMPQKSMTRAEGIALLSRSMDALKNTNLEEEEEETKTEEKDNSNKGSSGGSSGGGSSSGGGGSSSGGGGSSKPSQNIAKATQTKLVDLGRSQYVVVSFEEGFSMDNTKLIIDGVDVTSNFTNVDDDGTIVKWELTSLNPAKLVLESGSSKQEVKLTNNQSPEKPEVLASVPESYNLMANGAVAVWDYHLTNYDEAGNVRVYPEKTTFDLDASDESIPYYSPDAEVTEEGTGEVIVMFNYSTAEEKQWFDGITDVDLVAFNENNTTLNDKLQYKTEQVKHNGKTVGQISISLGQTNFYNNGRYNIRVTSGGQSWLFPIHVVNEKAPSMHLQGNGGVIQSGEDVRFRVQDMAYGDTMPVYRVTLTAPDGKIKELEKFTDYYLIGELFVLYNDGEGHNNIPDNGTYRIKVYAEGFKPMETTFVVGSGVNNAITYAGADAVTMATFDGGGSSGGDGGSNVMNAYLIFDSDLLANAEILTELGIEQESAAKIAERWDQDMTSWLYVFDKGGKVFYDYSGKSGAFTNMVDKAEADGEYLTFAEFQKEGTASVTQNRPYAAKYVLEDNLLGETQMGGSYIGRPAPELTVVESQEGSDLKLSCADTTYLAAIAEDGEIYLNGDLYPLEKGDFTVNLEDATLTIAKNKLELGENTIRISVGGYQDNEMKVDYDKTVEDTVLEVKAGNVRETVTVTVAGENATGDIWKYLNEVMLTYPGGREIKVLPDGQESIFDEKIGYKISGKDLILGKDLFTQAGKYQIAVTAKYYGTKTVEFTVVDGTSTETKPLPEYKGVTCEKSAFYEVTYTFTFTPSYDKNIEAWIGAVNKVTVNGTEYSSGVGDPYFTTNTTDQKIILHGDKPFKDGDNTVVISAEDYKDLTLTVGKDGTIGGDAGEDPGEPGENQDAPKAESLDFVDQSFGDDYYRLKFNLTEDEASAYLQAITSIKINEVKCNKQETSFSGDKNSYKFSIDGIYGGGKYQFIDFTADCFAEADKSYTVEIIANGYETLTLKIENKSLVDGD